MKNKTFILIILLTNFVLLSSYTICLMFLDNPLRTNFSDLGNQLEYQGLIIIWSLWTSTTFGYLLFKIKRKLKTWMIVTLVGLLNSACLWPYDPQMNFLLSQLHILLAYISFTFLTLGIISECIEYLKVDVVVGKKTLELVLVLLLFLGLLMMIVGGVTSLFETLYTIGMLAILIAFVYIKEKK